jgi:hypothetical protein
MLPLKPHIQIRPVSTVSRVAAGILAGKDGVDWSSSSDLPDILRVFFNEHKAQIAQCKSGNGVDRHLQGLKWRSELQNGGKADEFFSSPGWAALQANEVSTSQMTADGIQVCMVLVDAVSRARCRHNKNAARWLRARASQWVWSRLLHRRWQQQMRGFVLQVENCDLCCEFAKQFTFDFQARRPTLPH